MLSGSETVPAPPAADSVVLMDAVRRFEKAWHQGPRPLIDEYLPIDDPIRFRVLIELVNVDMELRLKAGEPARVEEYLARSPELPGERAVIVELIAAEHDLRRRGEPGLALDEFLQRFPQYHADLAEEIARASINVRDAPPRSTDPRAEAMPEVAGYEV